MRKLARLLGPTLLVALTHAQGQPTDPVKQRATAQAAVANADWKTAIDGFRALTASNPKDGQAWFMLGYSLHMDGKLDDALTAHLEAAKFPNYAPMALYNAACARALKGDKPGALDALDKAVTAGFRDTNQLDGDTDLDSLRGEARFKALAEKIASAASNRPEVQVYAGSFDRKLARMVLFGNTGSQGAVSISYGQPEWQEKYEQMLDDPKMQGRRWRMGRDEWTTLDASVDVTIGEQRLPAGIYYLTLSRNEGKITLTALDPAEVHKQTIDPYVAHQTKGGRDITLQHNKVDGLAKQLEITLEAGTDTGAGTLTIAFGRHRLSAAVQIHRKAAASK